MSVHQLKAGWILLGGTESHEELGEAHGVLWGEADLELGAKHPTLWEGKKLTNSPLLM